MPQLPLPVRTATMQIIASTTATLPNADKWLAATDVELANHDRNGTFVEFYVSPTVWLLGSMWIYEIKHDGRYKACLVALGNQLKEQAGDPESSSPTAGQLEFRTVVAISYLARTVSSSPSAWPRVCTA